MKTYEIFLVHVPGSSTNSRHAEETEGETACSEAERSCMDQVLT